MSQSDEWAHRTPRGKRASSSGNQPLLVRSFDETFVETDRKDFSSLLVCFFLTLTKLWLETKGRKKR
ncbi:hypothetical protein ABE41_019220 [Fictibacillus arsenicus]|uniref:Uncharacterized protein n=1 Tax=Fictibacillus arsenicus TaxID=255247 RepID=A0A1B1Z9T9_9BACL|nr:hypothetical protein ABE41_019220 [Fictibacillus arsenicus]